jgi:hypothetical protein
MGYRIRLGKISKIIHETKYKNKTYEELKLKYFFEDSEYYFWRPEEYTQLYEIGKYVSYDQGLSDFYAFDVFEKEEGEFSILSKEGLKIIIEDYHNNIKNYYKEIIDNFEEKLKNDDIKNHFLHTLNNWDNPYCVLPYYLDEEHPDGVIVKSWIREYAIFNLVYIYKFFDWENDYLIYSGW